MAAPGVHDMTAVGAWYDAVIVVAGQSCPYAVRPGLPSGSTPTPASRLLAEHAAGAPSDHVLLLDVTAALPALTAPAQCQITVGFHHAGMQAAAQRGLESAHRQVTWLAPGAEVPAGSMAAVYIEACATHEAWLRRLVEGYIALRPGGVLWAAAPNDAGGKRLSRDVTALFGSAHERSKAHQRLVSAVKPATDRNPLPWQEVAGIWPRTVWPTFMVAGRDYASLPGVFAHGRLDEGSALLCAYLPNLQGSRVLDLGGGVGVLTGTALARGARAVDVIDVDAIAVACLQRTFAADPVRVAWGDVLDGLPWRDATYDVVVSNPPFHAGKRTDESMVHAFVSTAAGHQRPGGTLWLVANAFLAYGPLLAAHYAQVSRVAETPAFVVWQAVR
jgi:16S rRNA (guanine1207-N2)-methyltransferase